MLFFVASKPWLLSLHLVLFIFIIIIWPAATAQHTSDHTDGDESDAPHSQQDHPDDPDTKWRHDEKYSKSHLHKAEVDDKEPVESVEPLPAFTVGCPPSVFLEVRTAETNESRNDS